MPGRGVASQSRAVLSLDAVTMRFPSALKTALPAPDEAYCNAVGSSEAVTMRLPSGLNDALHTGPL